MVVEVVIIMIVVVEVVVLVVVVAVVDSCGRQSVIVDQYTLYKS